MPLSGYQTSDAEASRKQVYYMVTVFGTALLSLTDAGYYKRPPPPSKLHYLPKPPYHHYNKHPLYSVRPSPPRNHIRPPTRPFLSKPAPPPFPPPSWKSNSNFRAPVVKEQFYSSTLSFAPEVTQHFLQDDDKGPIHTIPAPNLSLADRPANLDHDNSALNSVLSHASEIVKSKPTTVGYQVTEDPSAYKPYSGPAYFAPDPDPSLPTIQVPQTMDPYSVPSNGVTPLDLYQQQVANQQSGQISEHTSSTLSPQDLYQHLHGVQQQMTPELYQQYLQAASAQQTATALHQQLHSVQQQMTPELYQQYLQAASAQQPTTALNQQVFQAGLLYPQVAQFSQQNFHPQFETFNYNEQTQESAHGSDSFPSASSVSVGVKRAVPDTRISGESRHSVEEKDQEDISNQVDYEDEQSTELSNGHHITHPGINHQLIIKHENFQNGQIQRGHENVKQKTEEERQKEVIKNEGQAGDIEIINNEEQRDSVFINQRLRMAENMKHRQQVHLNYDKEGDLQKKHELTNQVIQDSQKPTNTRNDPREQMFTDTDSTEEEILDTSDKDQRIINGHMQNSVMRLYNRFDNENQQVETEEPSYDDPDSDYTLEEEKEINNTNKMAKPPPLGKSVNYNAQQNLLPYGAKLRPKRV